MIFLKIFEDYCQKMTLIHLYQTSMFELAQKELKDIDEIAEFSARELAPTAKPMSLQRMYFHSARHRDHYNFGIVTRTAEERRKSVFLHQNKQYQWLLAEAYEEFEDFLENAYANAGFINNDLWPLPDFGNITLSDMKGKDIEWFQDMAKKKKNTPSSILKVFRDKFDDLCNIEGSNELGVNLKLTITLIEHFRHIIVHKGGIVGDKEEFIKTVLRKANLERNGRHNKDDVNFITQYFGTGEYSAVIMLLEVPTNPEIPFNTYISVFDQLSGYLIAYSHLLCEQFEEMQDDNGEPKFARIENKQGITKR